MALSATNRTKILEQKHSVNCPKCHNTAAVATVIRRDGTLIYECQSCGTHSTAEQIREWGLRICVRQEVPNHVAEALASVK